MNTILTNLIPKRIETRKHLHECQVEYVKNKLQLELSTASFLHSLQNRNPSKGMEVHELDLQDGDEVFINIKTGEIRNNRNKKAVKAGAFSEVQMEIYQNGGLF